MIIPDTPAALDLPSKFTAWREFQQDAVQKATNDSSRFIVESMPTGAGKSLCYMALAKALNCRVCIVTSTKGLQDQLLNDFAVIGLRDIRGKANYTCGARPNWTCEDGHAARCTDKGTSSCPFRAAYNAARISPLVITSYSFWMAVHKYGTGLGKFGMLVLDEAHRAPDELASALQVRLSHGEIEEVLEAEFPEQPTSNQDWKQWAAETKLLAEVKRDQAQVRMLSNNSPKPAWVRKYNHLRNLVRKLAVVASMSMRDWVTDEQDWGFQFDPIRVSRYAESTLFLKIPRIILTSATVMPKTLDILGASDFTFNSYSSAFDPERSPIYEVPTQRIDHRTTDRRQWMLRMDQIIGRRLDRKGIIHTVSFKNRDQILRDSAYRQLFMSNYRDNEPISQVVERFKQASAPRLLVSPSVGMGYDFPGDDCEYQIITKVPFPDSRSRIVQARQQADPEYGSYLAMQALVQGCGRAMRSKDDRCENFIIDDHASWFVPKNARFAPPSFHACYKRVRALPAPAPKVGVSAHH